MSHQLRCPTAGRQRDACLAASSASSGQPELVDQFQLQRLVGGVGAVFRGLARSAAVSILRSAAMSAIECVHTLLASAVIASA